MLASGTFEGDPAAGEVVLEVRAKRGDADWSVIQSPFMRDRASTVAFEHKVTIDGDSLVYAEKTTLEIYGRTFEHTDENQLERV